MNARGAKDENVVHNSAQSRGGIGMVGMSVILVVGFAGLALTCACAMWRKAIRVQQDCEQRAASADGRFKSLSAQLRRLEQEVTRQGIELEDQGIQLETKSYWED